MRRTSRFASFLAESTKPSAAHFELREFVYYIFLVCDNTSRSLPGRIRGVLIPCVFCTGLGFSLYKTMKKVKVIVYLVPMRGSSNKGLTELSHWVTSHQVSKKMHSHYADLIQFEAQQKLLITRCQEKRSEDKADNQGFHLHLTKKRKRSRVSWIVTIA